MGLKQVVGNNTKCRLTCIRELRIENSIQRVTVSVWHHKAQIENFVQSVTVSEWWGGGGVNWGVILVRMCGLSFQNPLHYYTWALKIGTHSYIYLVTYRSKLPSIHVLVQFITHFRIRFSSEWVAFAAYICV